MCGPSFYCPRESRSSPRHVVLTRSGRSIINYRCLIALAPLVARPPLVAAPLDPQFVTRKSSTFATAVQPGAGSGSCSGVGQASSPGSHSRTRSRRSPVVALPDRIRLRLPVGASRVGGAARRVSVPGVPGEQERNNTAGPWFTVLWFTAQWFTERSLFASWGRGWWASHRVAPR